ncbi:unnamed protein product [Brachionus calyciflorus]|uniref:RING-type domain-containing protein n=1 Tax=Brachionus calyciflorus TaxID=104777 RepID=A0A813MAX0_9BILA|nr:unnamed protein product [Brachionus calyciflorus]
MSVLDGFLNKSINGDTGPINGFVNGNINGNVYGDITGTINGNINGNVFGNIYGSVNGNIKGVVYGNVYGLVRGKCQKNQSNISMLHAPNFFQPATNSNPYYMNYKVTPFFMSLNAFYPNYYENSFFSQNLSFHSQPHSTSQSVFNESNENEKVKSITNCPICFDELHEIKVKKRHLFTASCGHLICSTCLDNIFAEKFANDCPFCNRSLIKSDYHRIYI